MTRETFNQLPRNEQRLLLLTQGCFLEERQTSRHDVMLYQINQFYAEAYFVKNTNKLSFFKSFSGTEGLEPYLAQIDITDLLQQTHH
ncbi:hypothetical protein SAMN05444008_12344 [Cnuella takakiae]|uniref:Uncharacterized protein n=1 Tax=Cnuella takakiae TaxID=1302690 RepID=A0A1M5IDG5_9BACT|nr:hypothetical protein [Cnuella takakiae]OLY90811.1 hypothetical protein BUE76_02035 [Cnuella takakiae]SHG26418.1 hypothetical protein SAMN05444008_12344 [Cnuella takakiae]